MALGFLSADPEDYPEFSVGQGWGPLPDLDGFGADDAAAPTPPAPADPTATPAPVPSASAVQASSTVQADEWIDPQTTYTVAEYRIRDAVPYLTGTPSPEFPEQEDLSVFGWTGYPEPREGFGNVQVGPLSLGNPTEWLLVAGLTAWGGLVGWALDKKNRKRGAAIGAAAVGLPALTFYGIMSKLGGNAMLTLPPKAGG